MSDVWQFYLVEQCPLQLTGSHKYVSDDDWTDGEDVNYGQTSSVTKFCAVVLHLESIKEPKLESYEIAVTPYLHCPLQWDSYPVQFGL